jgi:protease-4
MMAMLLLVLITAGCANIYLGPRMEPFEEKAIGGAGNQKVLVIDIDGLISNREKRTLTGAQTRLGLVEEVREMLLKAEQDDAIRALLLRVDSPGGTVTASDIIRHQILRFKEKRGVPVYVSIGGLAASGGYYIAVAGDRIIAHPTSLTGSIGVIALKLNLQGLLEKVGVDWEVVKSADKKDFLSPLRPLTDEERRLFQETIDSFHERFVQVVDEGRPGLDKAAVKALADGRVYTAREALDNKLVDQIGYLDDAVEAMQHDLGVKEVALVTYTRPGEYRADIHSPSSGPTINMVQVDLGLSFDAGAPRFMYLWLP